jgi:hypothetical protein
MLERNTVERTEMYHKSLVSMLAGVLISAEVLGAVNWLACP